ncbi:MAG: sugar phosphorylase [Bacteroidales bacterium]|nr:sugar phosphorylase [Bacteroidales bacterium]
MILSDKTANKIAKHLQKIYGERFSESIVNEIYKLINDCHPTGTCQDSLWSQQDIILIVYGDSVLSDKKSPLKALSAFLKEYVNDTISCVHILPFFPYSSDDGFSVMDYMNVNPDLGDWHDIRDISVNYDLMTDLVINHVSQHHQWFVNYLNNTVPGKDYFIMADPKTDLSSVVRPRSSPLLTEFQSVDGVRYVWTTFSHDQVDLNFRNPAVLIEMIRVFLFYLQKGARIIRLDAIAFLWKQIGTSCLHLPETHEVVKLLRTVGTAVDPGFLLLTETNVPNRENLGYFGAGDEAHMVYQFSFPPLLLYTLFSGNAEYLLKWLASLPDPGKDCTFLNFTASHDGIGIRPLEGLLPHSEIEKLLEGMQYSGGCLSLKRNPDGHESVYEINITYFDALKDTTSGADDLQVKRFLCSQVIMAGLKGIPAFYLHSLLAATNDYEGMNKTGKLRSINRRKYSDSEIASLLGEETISQFVFRELKRIIDIRKTQSAFHPDSLQAIYTGNNNFVSLTRINNDTGETIHCISNISARKTDFFIQFLNDPNIVFVDLLGNQTFNGMVHKITFDPYQTVWLKPVVKHVGTGNKNPYA